MNDLTLYLCQAVCYIPSHIQRPWYHVCNLLSCGDICKKTVLYMQPNSLPKYYRVSNMRARALRRVCVTFTYGTYSHGPICVTRLLALHTECAFHAHVHFMPISTCLFRCTRALYAPLTLSLRYTHASLSCHPVHYIRVSSLYPCHSALKMHVRDSCH